MRWNRCEKRWTLRGYLHGWSPKPLARLISSIVSAIILDWTICWWCNALPFLVVKTRKPVNFRCSIYLRPEKSSIYFYVNIYWLILGQWCGNHMRTMHIAHSHFQLLDIKEWGLLPLYLNSAQNCHRRTRRHAHWLLASLSQTWR